MFGSALCRCWAGLYLEEDRDALVAGTDMMLKIAVQLLSKKRRLDGSLQIEDGVGDNKKS